MKRILQKYLLICIFPMLLMGLQVTFARQDVSKKGNSFRNGVLVKDIESLVMEDAAVKPVTKKEYIEKWEITSAKTTAPNSVEPTYMLSSAGYFKFIDEKTVLFKLNEQFPEQKGEFYQSPLSIKMYFPALDGCADCIRELEITRSATTDTAFRLLFNGTSQLFTIKSLR